MNTNEIYLQNALDEGIIPQAIIDSVNGVMDKSDEKGFVPKQFGKMMDMLINAKSVNNQSIDNSKLSSLVRNNMGRLDALLNDGLTPSEISMSIARQMTKNNPDDMKFLTSIMSKIKKKDLLIKMSHEKAKQAQYQKVNTMNTTN